MFVRYFASIEEPFEAVEASLLSPPREWLPGVDPRSSERLGSAVIRLSANLAGSELTKKVRVSVGPAEREPTKTSIPVSWAATGPKALFPKMSGTIEVARWGQKESLLAILVAYDPPLGKLGDLIDEALLHRLVWATMETFRDALAASLKGLADDRESVAATLRESPGGQTMASGSAGRARLA